MNTGTAWPFLVCKLLDPVQPNFDSIASTNNDCKVLLSAIWTLYVIYSYLLGDTQHVLTTGHINENETLGNLKDSGKVMKQRFSQIFVFIFLRNRLLQLWVNCYDFCHGYPFTQKTFWHKHHHLTLLSQHLACKPYKLPVNVGDTIVFCLQKLNGSMNLTTGKIIYIAHIESLTAPDTNLTAAKRPTAA